MSREPEKEINPYDSPQSSEEVPSPVVYVSPELYLRLAREERITVPPSELQSKSVIAEGQIIGVGMLNEPNHVLMIGKIINLSSSSITIVQITSDFAPNVEEV